MDGVGSLCTFVCCAGGLIALIIIYIVRSRRIRVYDNEAE